MSAALSVLTSPLRLADRLTAAQMAVMVAADAIRRHGASEGRTVAWSAGVFAGDIATQHAFEQHLVREGHARATLAEEDFTDRARAFEVTCRTRGTAQLTRLRVEVDLDGAALRAEAVARAARTAFVRLYDEGLLRRVERVGAYCPRCATVLDGAEVEPGLLETDLLTVRFPGGEGAGDVDVVLSDPELLGGVVAVALPDGHPLAGTPVCVPVVGHVVPTLNDPGSSRPRIVVPAHDPADLELARAHGLEPVTVLDPEGVVTAPGRLTGLQRYAAREAVTSMLVSEGALVASEPSSEPTLRCRCCNTVVVPALGRHWYLLTDDMEVRATDAIREAGTGFTPASAWDELLSAAGQAGGWCVSTQVRGAEDLPAWRCLDCTNTTVAVDPAASCGRCMGVLARQPGGFDARFLGAVWVLAAAGWPFDERALADRAATTMLVTTVDDVVRWVLPAAALGVHLAGIVPFARVSVHGMPPTTGVGVPADLDGADRRVLRAALASGTADLDAGRALLAAVESPARGKSDLDELEAACRAAFAEGAPAVASQLLVAAGEAGVPPDGLHRLEALARPLLGA